MDAITFTLLLVIRTYGTAALPPATVQAAREATSDSLAVAGARIEWVDCGMGAADQRRPCAEPVQKGELIVRFVDSSRAHVNPRDWALGFAYVDRVSATGSLATIYIDRVKMLARESGGDFGTLLGRVAAHEVGHLLLGTNEHRPQGLMRAEWSASSIQRRSARDWQFSRADSERLTKNLEIRTGN